MTRVCERLSSSEEDQLTVDVDQAVKHFNGNPKVHELKCQFLQENMTNV